LTGRGLRLLIMRSRGCPDCEKGCDRKRRDGRTAHPNCPFNPLHSRTCNADRSAGGTAHRRETGWIVRLTAGAGSATAPAARCRNCLRWGSFIGVILPDCRLHARKWARARDASVDRPRTNDGLSGCPPTASACRQKGISARPAWGGSKVRLHQRRHRAEVSAAASRCSSCRSASRSGPRATMAGPRRPLPIAFEPFDRPKRQMVGAIPPAIEPERGMVRAPCTDKAE
jgi:hypothetical protein